MVHQDVFLYYFHWHDNLITTTTLLAPYTDAIDRISEFPPQEVPSSLYFRQGTKFQVELDFQCSNNSKCIKGVSISIKDVGGRS